jgi:hypothetical protein
VCLCVGARVFESNGWRFRRGPVGDFFSWRLIFSHAPIVVFRFICRSNYVVVRDSKGTAHDNNYKNQDNSRKVIQADLDRKERLSRSAQAKQRQALRTEPREDTSPILTATEQDPPTKVSKPSTRNGSDFSASSPLGDKAALEESCQVPKGFVGKAPVRNIFGAGCFVHDLEALEPVPLAEMEEATENPHDMEFLTQEDFFEGDDDESTNEADLRPAEALERINTTVDTTERGDEQKHSTMSTTLIPQPTKTHVRTHSGQVDTATTMEEEPNSRGKRRVEPVEVDVPASKKSRSTSKVEEQTKATTLVKSAASLLFAKKKCSTVAEALQCCIQVLQTSYKASTIVGGGEDEHVHFSSRLDQITLFLENVIKTQGGSADSSGAPAALHVCGVPGTGKTMGVKYCCDETLKWAGHWAKDTVDPDERSTFQLPVVCHMNVAHLQGGSKKDVLDTILHEIREAVKRHKGKSKVAVIGRESLKRKSRSIPPVILVLDEVDLLLGAPEGALKTLLEWAADEDIQFGFIGISNSVENSKGRRLAELGSVSSEWASQLFLNFSLQSLHFTLCLVWCCFNNYHSFATRLSFRHMARRNLLTLSSRELDAPLWIPN